MTITQSDAFYTERGAVHLEAPAPQPDRFGTKVHHPLGAFLTRLPLVYLALFSVPFFVQQVVVRLRGQWVESSAVLTFISSLYERVWRAWESPISWVGVHILGTGPLRYGASGGGSDGIFFWIYALIVFCISVAIAAIWALRKQPTESEKVVRGIRTAIRYLLAFTMIEYGSTKLFQLQFGSPRLEELVRPLGDFTPMDLIWSAIGSSSAYTIYAGASELAGAILLLFKRTALLGALITIGVLTNVLMLNIGYDIPVKLFSVHLIMMAVVVATPHLHRLVAFFILNRAAPPHLEQQVSVRRQRHLLIGVAKWLLITAAVVMTIWHDRHDQYSYGKHRAKPPLYGLYETVEMVRSGEQVPLRYGEPNILRRLVVEFPSVAFLHFADGSRQVRRMEIDTAAHRLTLISPDSAVDTFDYSAKGNRLFLIGTMGKDRVRVEFERIDRGEFTLIKHGFHWVARVR